MGRAAAGVGADEADVHEALEGVPDQPQAERRDGALLRGGDEHGCGGDGRFSDPEPARSAGAAGIQTNLFFLNYQYLKILSQILLEL